MSDAAGLTIAGTVAPGWEAVRHAFADNWERYEETGAAVAVYHHGRPVVDLTGGWFDRGRTQRYGDEALQLVFSTTKGVTAVAVAQCVERGLLDYDERVANYWPEFGTAGKDDVTVAQLLSHQAGLITVPGITLDEALDWATVTARLASTEPLWTPGDGHGYHALTYGWLAGELVRRVDPAGRSFSQWVQDEIAAPLDLELWVGLPEEQEGRVSPLIAGSPPAPDDPAAEMMARFFGPGSLAYRALYLDEAFAPSASGQVAFNSREVRAACIPAANGVTNARSLARMYAATLGPVDGVQLLDPAVVDRARVTVTPENEPDRCLIMPTTFGMGFMTHGFFTPYLGPGSFGHPGAGGSVAFAQPESGVAFAYVMNQMASNLAGDRRAADLMDAVQSCLR
jgi:CubicO group peptidase (beta-lactamase class C family)